MIWLPITALAAPPDKPAVDRISTQGSGEVDHLLFSADGNLLIGRTKADGKLFVLDLDNWEVYSRSPCTVSSVAEVPYDVGSQIVVGCSDGTATAFTFDPDGATAADRLAREVEDNGDFTTWNVATQGGSLVQLFWDHEPTDPFVFAYESGGDLDTLHVFAADDGSIDDEVYSGYPQTSLNTGFVDGVIDSSGGLAYIAHGNSRVSTLTLGNGLFSRALTTNSLYDYTDLGPTLGLNELTFAGVWAVDSQFDSLVRLDTTGQLDAGPYTTSVVDPRAVVAGGTYTDGWLLIAGDGIEIHTLINGFPGDITNPYFSNAAADIHIQDAVANVDYAFGGGEAGNVVVLTALPWVAGATVDPATGREGDTVVVTFSIDEASDWQLCLEGTRTSCEDELASGSVDGAETVTVEVTITDDFVEGTNRMYILADDGQGVGHARVEVVIDDVPTTPSLPEGAVGFADEALNFSFGGISDADLDYYELVISDVPFTRDDFLADPDFLPEDPDVNDGPSNPITIQAAGGESIAMTIAPLENGVTYYLALRAIDQGGLESEMSNVVTGTPEKTYTASELADEPGGGPCSTGGALPGSWLVFGGLAALVRRRRAVALGALALSSTAMADEVQRNRDQTRQYGNFELRYGGFLNLEDDAIKQVFGGGHNMLQVEVGPQITRFFEIDLEAGFYQELATTVTADGAASARKTMLTMFPLGMSVSGRLHILDEQIIVPYGKYGVDFVYWTELTDNSSGGKNKVQGTKLGQHFAVGAGLLLDVFAPSRASLLEAYSGINDTYITFEFRRQMVDSRQHPWAAADESGFTFTGNMITIGLKLDY